VHDVQDPCTTLLTSLRDITLSAPVGRTALLETIAGLQTKDSIPSSPHFGSGSSISLAVWKQLLDELLGQDLVQFELMIFQKQGTFNVTKVTLSLGEKGRAFLENPGRILVNKSSQKYAEFFHAFFPEHFN